MKINYYTASFPYPKGETFIENEIPVIADLAEKIKIFPYHTDNINELRIIPQNCTFFDHNNLKTEKINFKDYYIILKILIIEFFLTRKKRFFLKKIRTWLSYLKQILIVINKLEKNGHIRQEDIHYSYWMNEWAIALTILKMKKKINHFVFRCGGFDIWDERNEGNYLPFRNVVYKYASGIYPNSETSAIYLRSKNRFPNKINCEYWGTKDFGPAPFVNDSDKFILVSCSNVIPLKRVDLILKIIQKLDFAVEWHHFGDGPGLEALKIEAENIKPIHTVNFHGRKPNEYILNFYKQNTVHLFITTSSTEGLPVSIQEAISFGIPVIATNVGGIKEVVTKQSGFLIEADFDPKQAAEIIKEFNYSEKNKPEFRNQVREFWLNNFSAKNNYTTFFHILESFLDHPPKKL